MKSRLGQWGCAGLGTMLVWMASCVSAFGYGSYDPNDASQGCYQCHSQFLTQDRQNRGPLHDLHVGAAQMTGNCMLCHTSIGDNPHTDSSGADASHGCNGCHAGPGLRLHHANAGAPPDQGGLVCANCHQDDPTPPGENIPPPYYSRGDVNVDDPCLVAEAGGGEDYDGDGKGLDNDGDLAYEGDDTDCGLAADDDSWGTLKAQFR
jgi:hypothetical protein